MRRSSTSRGERRWPGEKRSSGEATGAAGMTSTGHGACCTQCSLIESSRIPAAVPSPRLSTISMSADRAANSRTSVGRPCRIRGRTGTVRTVAEHLCDGFHQHRVGRHVGGGLIGDGNRHPSVAVVVDRSAWTDDDGVDDRRRSLGEVHGPPQDTLRARRAVNADNDPSSLAQSLLHHCRLLGTGSAAMAGPAQHLRVAVPSHRAVAIRHHQRRVDA